MKRDVVFDIILSQNKLTIVFEHLCHIVAHIGDDLNESSAIKKAHINFVMGKVESDDAQETTALLLFNNNYIR